MLIRFQRIYNLWSIHVVILSFLGVLQSFYSKFISFFGLTYWPSAQCQLLFFACFLHRRKSISNGVQTLRNFMCIFLWRRTPRMGQSSTWGCPEGGTTHQGVPGGPGAPRWVVPTSVASRTPSLHYKFPNILKPFGEALDEKFCRRKVSVSAKTNLDPVPAPCRRGQSSPVAIFIIPAATTMRRE